MATIQLQIGKLAAYNNREALIPYEQNSPIVLIHNSETQTLAAELCESFALQLLAQHPIGHAKVLLCEATPSRHYPQLKRLYAEIPQQLSEQFFTDQDCHKQLIALNDHAHRRFALFASTHVTDITQYNATAYHLETIFYLLITDINQISNDTNFLQLLQNLCREGAVVGIVPILLYADDETQDTEFIESNRKLFVSFWQQIIPSVFGLDCRSTPPQPLNNRQLSLWSLFYKYQLVVGVDLQTRTQWADTMIKQTKLLAINSQNQNFFRIPIGMEEGQRAYFCLGEAAKAYHAMIAGTTGSGKSTLLNNLIVSACEIYNPEELRLWLFDCREGEEFHIFTGLTHIDALYIDNNKQYAINAFSAIEQEMQRRVLLFREAGFGSRIANYNRHAAHALPRLVIIIDEVQNLLNDADITLHARRMLAKVTRQGASVGIHIILSSQTYQNVELGHDVTGQVRLRIGLQLADAMSCSALMGRDNKAPLNLPSFTAVYNNNFGEACNNQIIALDELSPERLQQRLQLLK